MSSTASTSTTTSSESVSTVSTSTTQTGSSASTSSISSTSFTPSTSFTSSTSSTSSTSTSASTSTPSTKNTSAGTSSSRTDTVGTSSSTQTGVSSSTQSSTTSSSSSSASVSSTTWVSTSTTHTQNTASQTSSPTSSHSNTTSASSSPSSSASSSTTTDPQRELSTTSAAPSSTFQLPSTSQAASTSQAPISTSAVSPSPSTSGVPESTPAVVHELFIDAGNCANVGTPKVLDEATGSNVGLTSLGGGKYSLVMTPSDVPGGGIGAFVFMADDGSRCGQDAGYCSVVHVTFDETNDILISIERAGDRGRNMYPVKIWMDDAFTWDAQPANSSVNASHCWGWSNVECPNSFTYRNDPPWTISSESHTARLFVSFCPSDGPALSDVPPNPNPPDYEPESEGTFILLPTSTVIPVSTFTFGTTSSPSKGVAAAVPTITESVLSCDGSTTCVLLNTYLSIGEPSTVVSEFTVPPQGTTVYYSTFIVLGTTTTIPVTTYFGRPATVSPTPTPTVTSWIMASTDTQRSTVVSGWTFLTLNTPTSTPPGTVSTITSLPTSTRRRTRTTTALSTSTARTRANVVGTIDDVTTSQEPAPTVSDSATTTPLPVSNDGLVTTSWTTWVTVGNTTSTIVVGEVGVQTTVPVTYALEPSTTIPIGELSSISVRSTSTALPSPSNTVSAKAESSSRDNSSVIAGATVGTLVGLTLAFLLFWLFCYKRRRRRSGDYMAQRASPVWSGAGGGGGSGPLDLDSEPRVRESFVEPWVQPLPPPPRRKEMESLSGGVSAGYGATSMSGGAGTSAAAGPSREPESSSTESGPGPSSLSSHFVSSNEHAALTRPGKTVVRGQSQSSSVPRRPEQSHYQRPSLANPSVSLLPTPFEAGAPGSPRARGPDQTGQPRYLVDRRFMGEAQQPRRYVDDPEQPRHNAIPPQYNEAWNTAL